MDGTQPSRVWPKRICGIALILFALLVGVHAIRLILGIGRTQNVIKELIVLTLAIPVPIAIVGFAAMLLDRKPPQ